MIDEVINLDPTGKKTSLASEEMRDIKEELIPSL